MEYVEIKKIGKVVTGNTPSKKENKYYDQNYIEFVKPSNFISGKITNIKKGEEYLSYEGMKKGRVANKGDVLVTCIGNIGNVGIVEKKVCFNQQINAIKCNKDYINNKYLANVIRHISPLLTYMANKAVVPILNKTQLENIKIPIFSMETQEEIANILEIIQKNIDKRKEQLLLVDELIKSRFIEMFGDPIKNDKGWEKEKLLENVVEKVENISKNSEIIISYIDISSINNLKNRIETYKNYYIDEAPSRAKKIINRNDILMSTVRPNLKNIALFDIETENKAIASTGFCILRTKTKLNTLYLFNVLLSNSFTNELSKNEIGANYPAVTENDIKNVKIALPPLTLQNEFAEFVTKTNKLKFEAEKSLKEMENLYESLMQKFFKQN